MRFSVMYDYFFRLQIMRRDKARAATIYKNIDIFIDITLSIIYHFQNLKGFNPFTVYNVHMLVELVKT